MLYHKNIIFRKWIKFILYPMQLCVYACLCVWGGAWARVKEG